MELSSPNSNITHSRELRLISVLSVNCINNSDFCLFDFRPVGVIFVPHFSLGQRGKEDEQKAAAKIIQFRDNRKELMIDNGYPQELVRFCDMQELAEGQARYIEYNLGNHLGLYEDNDPRLSDLDRSGWFYVTGFNHYNLLNKRGFNMADAYSGDIHTFDYYLK